MRRRGSFDIEDMPERVDTGIGGSDNTQVLSTTLTLSGNAWGQSATQTILYYCTSASRDIFTVIQIVIGRTLLEHIM